MYPECFQNDEKIVILKDVVYILQEFINSASGAGAVRNYYYH